MYKKCEKCDHKVNVKYCDSKTTENGLQHYCPKCDDLLVKHRHVRKGEAGFIKNFKPSTRSIRCFVCGTKDVTTEKFNGVDPCAGGTVSYRCQCNGCGCSWLTDTIKPPKPFAVFQ